MKKIQLLLAENHPLVLQGFARLLIGRTSDRGDRRRREGSITAAAELPHVLRISRGPCPHSPNRTNRSHTEKHSQLWNERHPSFKGMSEDGERTYVVIEERKAMRFFTHQRRRLPWR